MGWWRHAVAVLAGVVVVVAASGCGQTDFATGVGASSATLNATITSHDPGVKERTWFQFWPAATPSAKQRTERQAVTATGPFSATVTGLAPDTTYAFRVCGRRGTVRACAQTRTFTTSRDAVQAIGTTESVHTPGLVRQLRGIDVDVTEGRPGGHAAATLSQTNIGGTFELPLGSPTATQITCLAVSGHVAVVGFRNDVTLPPDAAFLQYGSMTLFDGGPAGAGRDSVSATWTGKDPDPAACAIPSDLSGLLPLQSGDVNVVDSSAAP
jgi:hypothetical protein